MEATELIIDSIRATVNNIIMQIQEELRKWACLKSQKMITYILLQLK